MTNNGWIYQIRNKINNKVYIGSTLNYKNRVNNHINKLKSKKHRNIYLIRAWHKYGEKNFEFNILEFFENITHEKLRSIEQSYLNNIKNKYNVSKRADCPYMGKTHFNKMHKASKAKCSKEWIITEPSGLEYKILSLKQFCEKNNLSLSLMHKVAKGKNSQHRGWKCRYAEDKEFRYKPNVGHLYKIIKGKDEYIIQNLTKFINQNKLAKSCIYRIINTGKNYKGYIIYKLNNT